MVRPASTMISRTTAALPAMTVLLQTWLDHTASAFTANSRVFSKHSSVSSSPTSQSRRPFVSTTTHRCAAVPDLAHRLDGLEKPTVWHEFTPLSQQHGSINLGQGFPDWEPPAFVQEAMKASIYERKANQYARANAHLPLAQVLAQDYEAKWNGMIALDPVTQVATTVGCTQALFCALQGLINPGDQVILLEPAFDIYHAQVKMAGGECVFVPLRPNNELMSPNDNKNNAGASSASDVFQLDLNELEAAITDQTRILLLNTPHNPTGKMFSQTELQGIAEIVERHPQITVISDEVYEHIIFDPENEPHISFATLPGMFERTLTLSSSGKTFSCTGWKVGWAVGPPHLVQAVVAVQQWVNFSAPTPNQDAIAQALLHAREPYQGFDTYYAYLANDYKRKRGILQTALSQAGLTPVSPPGSFFIMADTSQIHVPNEFLKHTTPAMPVHPMPRDWACSRWLTQDVGVTAIPPSAFYSTPNIPLARNLLRFAFCKSDETLLQAQERLVRYFGDSSS